MSDDDLSDDDLINGLKSKNFIAQQKFLQEFGPKLSENFIKNTGDLTEMEIEDAIFDRLYHFIEKPEKLSLGRPLWSLLFVCVKRKIIDVQRKKNKEPMQFSLDTVGRKVAGQLIQDEDEDNAVNLYSRIPVNVLNEARMLASEINLSEDEKEHLRLRLEEGFESKEISEFLKIKSNTESVRWNRLMSKIREKLDNYPSLNKYIQEQEELAI